MYVSVWFGGSLLSLSLWIVAGMVVAGRDSRGEGEELWPSCNCGDAEGLDEAITGQSYRDILVHPNLSCCFQPSCFIVDYSKQCIMVSLVSSLLFE
jgi:hypothetical protein